MSALDAIGPFTPNGIITLTTDFGTEDGWVGAMKGVILRIAPRAAIHDLAHDVPPQDIARGAACLAAAVPEFPLGTVHVAVVDPGVGTSRAGVVIVVRGQMLVGPDNHLFDDVIAKLGSPEAVRSITLGPDGHRFLLPPRSATFHGRDVFAPTAAALAAGLLALDDIGPAHVLAPPLADPTTDARDTDPTHASHASVRGVDRFGNLMTTLTAVPAPPSTLTLPDGTRVRAVTTYGDAAPGELVCLMGSEGIVEIAVRDGSAAARTGLARGARLTVSRS